MHMQVQDFFESPLLNNTSPIPTKSIVQYPLSSIALTMPIFPLNTGVTSPSGFVHL